MDRETDDLLTFTIIAVDSGTPQLSATAEVTVNVIDVNDNSAVFDAHNSEYSVPENSVRGFAVTTLTAQDPDLGDFGDVFYSIETGHDGKFSIEQSTVRKLMLVSSCFIFFLITFSKIPQIPV